MTSGMLRRAVGPPIIVVGQSRTRCVRPKRRSLLPRKQIPHPAFEYLGKLDQFKVGDAPQAALDLPDTGAWDIPASTLAGRSQIILRPRHRDSQTADLRPDQVLVLSAHSAGMST